MTSSDAFADRMAHLDELVEECRSRPPFANSIMRDTSNRSNRDWPWWSVELEQTDEHASDKQRLSATVRLNATQSGDPGSFEGEWLVRVWQGVSADSFRATGRWPLPWDEPTPQDLEMAMKELLDAARAAIAEDRRCDQSNVS